MVPKLVAAWLVALVIVPFTAPFSTCDLTGLFGTAHGQYNPFAPPTSAAIAHDAAVPTVPCISSAGRVKLVPLSGAPLPHAHVGFASVDVISCRAAVRFNRRHDVPTTILRL
jgi:hypothetical protein